MYDFYVKDDRQYIGAYGAVYLFTKYLRKNMEGNVFSRVHEMFRNSADKNISVASLLYASVPKEYRDEIEQQFNYPSFIESGFLDREETWLSKMTLDFILYTIADDIGACERKGWSSETLRKKTQKQMIYMEMAPQFIEGGGRIIVALENGTFTIPSDAQEGLIYIGLDEDFRPLPGLYTAAGVN